MSTEDAETALASAAAAVAAAVASLPVDQAAQHHLAQTQLMALQHAHGGEQEQEGDADGGFSQQGDMQFARKPRKLRKPNDVARCQVDGCGRDLSDAKLYLRRYSVCEPHFKAEWVMLSGGRFRFCQQCNKFQPLDNFSGTRRSCKARSEDRNLRRRKQRTDERAAAGDEGDVGAGSGARLIKGGPNLGGLTVPTRAALGDNGMLRQLGGDSADPNAALNQLQYVTQMQQLLMANNAGAGLSGIGAVSVGGGAPGVAGGQMQMPPSAVDLAALVVGGDLSALGAGSPNANALSILSAAAAANGAAAAAAAARGAGGTAAGGSLGTLADPSVSGNVLQQLQLAQLASALAKGGAIGAAGAVPGGAPGAAAAAAGGAGGLAAALGGVGMSMGLGAGASLAAGLNGAALTQQLLAQQAASVGGAALGAGLGGVAGPGGIMPLGDAAASVGGNLDLQSLMAQQILQQTAGSSSTQPVLVLHNQNVMLLSLDSLGLLQQQAK